MTRLEYQGTAQRFRINLEGIMVEPDSQAALFALERIIARNPDVVDADTWYSESGQHGVEIIFNGIGSMNARARAEKIIADAVKQRWSADL